MATQTVDVLIEGGKATAAPPLGPAMGPLGVNIGQVVADINKKTADYKGMQVPVSVTVDEDTKEYTIKIGTPPATALIKKEANVQKGAGNPLRDKVADIVIEQAIKVAIMKEDDLLGADLKAKVREVVGTCQSMGILVEGDPAPKALARIAAGEFDKQINARKTEISAAEQAELEEERKRLKEEMEARREEFIEEAQKIVSAGGDRGDMKAKMTEAGIPPMIIDEVLPEADPHGAEGAAPETTE